MRAALPPELDAFVLDPPPAAAYLALTQKELRARAEAAQALLHTPCGVCPRACRVNRARNETGFCRVGRYAAVASAFPHFGEEDVLRGWRGSGTVFFAGCNLRCVFCQNADISHRVDPRWEVTPRDLARIFLDIQRMGCHNLNLVTPEHVVPQVLEALAWAVEEGFRLPIVYNTSAYDSLRSLQLLEGIVDVYMPDFKVWTRERARRWLRAPDYPERARESLQEMHRQVGVLRVDPQGLAVRGVLLRHLVMPGALDETRAILHWVARALSRDTYVNLMDQYHPAGEVTPERFPELRAPLSRETFREALAIAREAGLWRLDRRFRGYLPV